MISSDDDAMRNDMDGWHFCIEGEHARSTLARFLNGFEELRARLAPSKYPNLEISDEGYLWFNIDATIGTIEVMAFPFGFSDMKAPFIAVSLPRKAEDIDLGILERLRKTSSVIAGAQLFANKRGITAQEILAAYKRDRHPPLAFTSDFDEILDAKGKGVFFSYLGFRFSVSGRTVLQIERMIRNIVSKLEGK